MFHLKTLLIEDNVTAGNRNIIMIFFKTYSAPKLNIFWKLFVSNDILDMLDHLIGDP